MNLSENLFVYKEPHCNEGSSLFSFVNSSKYRRLNYDDGGGLLHISFTPDHIP